jgi:hypothetical protein
MNRVATLPESRHDDVFGHKVTFRGNRRADTHGLVRKPHMEASRIRRGIHRDGTDAHLAATADYADGYLAAIRYQYAFYRHTGIVRFNGAFVKTAARHYPQDYLLFFIYYLLFNHAAYTTRSAGP